MFDLVCFAFVGFAATRVAVLVGVVVGDGNYVLVVVVVVLLAVGVVVDDVGFGVC